MKSPEPVVAATVDTEPVPARPFPAELLPVAVLAGAAVMVLHLAGSRHLEIHFGTGPYGGGMPPAVTLGALALGCGAGALRAGRAPSRGFAAAVLSLAAAWVAVIPLMSRSVIDWSWSRGLQTGSWLAALALLFPPCALTGLAFSMILRLEAAVLDWARPAERRALRRAGFYGAAALAGAFTGSLLAPAYLIPGFRFPVVMGVTAGALAVAALLTGSSALLRGRLFPAAAGALAVMSARPLPAPSGLGEVRRSPGSELRVVTHASGRYLLEDQVVQGGSSASGVLLDKPLYHLAARVLLARPEAAQAALIGLGNGGLLPLLGWNGMNVECVEPSRDVVELDRRWFQFSHPASQVHITDGRAFLRLHPGSFDVVVLNAYRGDQLVGNLFTREGLETARTALRPGGLLAVNSWGLDAANGRPNALGASLRATLQAVFPEVLPVPAAGNLLFLASTAPVTARRGPVELPAFDGYREFTWLEVPATAWPAGYVLTDDRNTLNGLEIASTRALRAERHASFPPELLEALAWE